MRAVDGAVNSEKMPMIVSTINGKFGMRQESTGTLIVFYTIACEFVMATQTKTEACKKRAQPFVFHPEGRKSRGLYNLL